MRVIRRSDRTWKTDSIAGDNGEIVQGAQSENRQNGRLKDSSKLHQSRMKAAWKLHRGFFYFARKYR